MISYVIQVQTYFIILLNRRGEMFLIPSEVSLIFFGDVLRLMVKVYEWGSASSECIHNYVPCVGGRVSQANLPLQGVGGQAWGRTMQDTHYDLMQYVFSLTKCKHEEFTPSECAVDY